MQKVRPTLLLGLLSTAIIAIFLSLGFWQLERADERRTRDAQQQERAQLTPVYITSFPTGAATTLAGRRVRIRGQYLPEQFLLDNQVREKQPGYHVLSPFALTDLQQVVLINRGWVPAKERRDQLPAVPVPTAQDHLIEGTVHLPQANPFTDPEHLMEDLGWPQRIQDIDYERMAERLGEAALVPATIRLAASEPHGFARQWPAPPMSADKHTGYAIQWFAMATAVLFLFLAYLLVARRD